MKVKIYFGKTMYEDVQVANWTSDLLPENHIVLEAGWESGKESDFKPGNNINGYIEGISLALNGGTMYGICGISIHDGDLILCAC